MHEIKLTSKRQATFPVAVCEALGLAPGDTIVLESREVDGAPAWVLRAPRPDWSWAGALRRYGEGRSHRWRQIEESIARGMAGDDRP